MANRREFIEKALVGSGVVAFMGWTHGFSLMLRSAIHPGARLIPEGWEFYESNGNVVHPIYGSSGSLSTRHVCWLLQKSGRQWFAIPVEFTLEAMKSSSGESIVARLCNAIATEKPVPVNLNGGNLPLPKVA